MALAYLLDPVFQIENTAGKPASGGWLEVYVAGSREKYYCASDFDGTLHPFRIELDSLGANIVLADDSQSYDVYVYNRYGGLLMSRYNVSPSNGGGGVSLSTITSTDGSIIVTQTANGVDLRVDSEAPSTLRCSATSLLADDVFDFSELQRDGQNAFVNNGEVVVNEGWWHYDVTARLRWPGNPAENVESEISLYCVNGSDSVSFDRSYGHDETLQLSGEFKSTQDGTAFNVGVNGIPSGMTVDLVDFGIHSIIGNGAGGKYDAGTGIDIDEPNRVISVDFDEVQAKLTAGDGVTIDSDNEISVDTSVIQRALSPGNGISLDSDDNITVKVDGDSITFNGDGELQANFPAQVQSDWTEADSTDPSYIQNKPAETTLAAGSNITITESGSTLTIAATAAPQVQADWNEADNTAVDYIKNKPNLARVALTGEYSDLAHTPHIPSTTSQLDNDSGFIAGDEVPRYQAHADWQASSSEAGYIYNKPFIPTETSDLHNDSGYITASDVPINQVQSDWTESDSFTPEYIKNKPSEKSLVAGSNITLTEAADSVTIAATVPAQQQADWTEADNTDPSYIQNKPSLATVATSGLYSDLSGTPDLSLKEDVANKAQSINTSSTTDYPSSKATADFVNSSVSTNTAKFLGNYTLTDLSLTYPATDAQIETALDGYAFSPTPTNNDYVYVEIQDPLTPGVADIVKRFKFDGANWLYEYSLNNSSFTAAEIAAIDSGITSTKVGNYDNHLADTTIHVTSTDKTTWNGKQDAISDLNTIRTGAGLGATAVQPGDLATVATSGDYDDLLNKPAIPAAQVQSNWTEADNTDPSYIQNKPSLATVATSGLYSDLSGTPTIVDNGKIYGMDGTESYNDIYTKMVVDGTGITWVLDRVSPYTGKATYTACGMTSDDASNTYGYLRLACVMRAGNSSQQITVFLAEVHGGPTGFGTPTYSLSSTPIGLENQVYSWNSNGVAIARSINEVPSYTTSEDGKVLGVVDNSGTASLEWVTPGSGSSDLFYATYSSTTFNDIQTAVNDGKYVILSRQGYLIPLTAISGVGSFAKAYFQTINNPYGDSSRNNLRLTTYTCSYNDQWSYYHTFVPPDSSISDAGKVLTVNSSGNAEWSTPAAGGVTDVEVDGTSVVSQGVASITMPTVDQTYDGTSANAQSGVAVASAISTKQDTISDLATIRSGAADGATAVQPGDLATVATSGLYSDLSGTPTINNVPVVTSSDDSKVLKASYTGGVGSYSWEQESGGTVTDVEVDGVSVVSQGVASITMPTVDQTYNSASANAQSGVAVAGALANINQVPSSTSADEGKILTVDSNGDPEWATGGGGTQADWSEADPTAPSYIENKPVPKTLVAGTGIVITETTNDLTVAATGVAINKTTPELCGSFMGEPVYTKLYEFTGTVGTSDTTVNFTIDEVVATGSTVTRIWLDPSNSFIEYGSASVKLPLTYFLSSARHGSVFVVSQSAGTLSFRGVDTSSVGLTFFLAVKYTDPTP